MSISKPMCRKCCKPVDAFIIYNDGMTMELVVASFCHGEKDEARVTHLGLVRMPKDIYRAFTENPFHFIECFGEPPKWLEAHT